MSNYTVDIPPHVAAEVRRYAKVHRQTLEDELSEWICAEVTMLNSLAMLKASQTGKTLEQCKAEAAASTKRAKMARRKSQ